MFTSFEQQQVLTKLEDTLRFQQIQAGAFSFICLMSCLFTAAAAVRIPLYLETGDIPRLLGVGLLGMVVLLCTIDNARTHIDLMAQRRMLTKKPQVAFEG